LLRADEGGLTHTRNLVAGGKILHWLTAFWKHVNQDDDFYWHENFRILSLHNGYLGLFCFENGRHNAFLELMYGSTFVLSFIYKKSSTKCLSLCSTIAIRALHSSVVETKVTCSGGFDRKVLWCFNVLHKTIQYIQSTYTTFFVIV